MNYLISNAHYNNVDNRMMLIYRLNERGSEYLVKRNVPTFSNQLKNILSTISYPDDFAMLCEQADRNITLRIDAFYVEVISKEMLWNVPKPVKAPQVKPVQQSLGILQNIVLKINLWLKHWLSRMS